MDLLAIYNRKHSCIDHEGRHGEFITQDLPREEDFAMPIC